MGIQRGMAHFRGEESSFGEHGGWQAYATTVLSFGLYRLGGHLGKKSFEALFRVDPLALTPPRLKAWGRFCQNALPQLGTYGAILADQYLSWTRISKLRVFSWDQLFLDSTQSFLHLKWSGRLADQLLGPRFAAWQRHMDQEAKMEERQQREQGEKLYFPGLQKGYVFAGVPGVVMSGASLPWRSPLHWFHEKHSGSRSPVLPQGWRVYPGEGVAGVSRVERDIDFSPVGPVFQYWRCYEVMRRQCLDLILLSESHSIGLAHHGKSILDPQTFSENATRVLDLYLNLLNSRGILSSHLMGFRRLAVEAENASTHKMLENLTQLSRHLESYGRHAEPLEQYLRRMTEAISQGDVDGLSEALLSLRCFYDNFFNLWGSKQTSYPLAERPLFNARVLGMLQGVSILDSLLRYWHQVGEKPPVQLLGMALDTLRLNRILRGVDKHPDFLRGSLRTLPVGDVVVLGQERVKQVPPDWLSLYVPALVASHGGNYFQVREILRGMEREISLEDRAMTYYLARFLCERLYVRGSRGQGDFFSSRPEPEIENFDFDKNLLSPARELSYENLQSVLGTQGNRAVLGHFFYVWNRYGGEPQRGIEWILQKMPSGDLRQEVLRLFSAAQGAYHGPEIFFSPTMHELREVYNPGRADLISLPMIPEQYIVHQGNPRFWVNHFSQQWEPIPYKRAELSLVKTQDDPES